MLLFVFVCLFVVCFCVFVVVVWFIIIILLLFFLDRTLTFNFFKP